MNCPKCGREIPSRKGATEASTPLDSKRMQVTRHFSGECPNHGFFVGAFILGHHITFNNAELKRMFPKGIQQRLKQKLSAAEFRDFRQMLHGKRPLDRDRLKRWLAAV